MINNLLLFLFLTKCIQVLTCDNIWFPLSGKVWSFSQQALQGYLLFGWQKIGNFHCETCSFMRITSLNSTKDVSPQRVLKIGLPPKLFSFTLITLNLILKMINPLSFSALPISPSKAHQKFYIFHLFADISKPMISTAWARISDVTYLINFWYF